METQQINDQYPRYIDHEGKRIRVISPLHHTQTVGYPVDDRGDRVIELPPPPTPEQQLAALYPETESEQSELVAAGTTKWKEPKRK